MSAGLYIKIYSQKKVAAVIVNAMLIFQELTWIRHTNKPDFCLFKVNSAIILPKINLLNG
jgi:hypothetical protein